MADEHKALRWLLPKSWFEAVKRGTKEWLAECPDGHVQDIWDAGGIRYKAAGEPRTTMRCLECGRVRWHKLRKKSPQEKIDVP